MKQVLEVIIKSLVNNKENVEITEIQVDNNTKFEVKVDSTEMGNLIGKQGKTAKAIRTLMKAASAKYGKKVLIEFID